MRLIARPKTHHLAALVLGLSFTTANAAEESTGPMDSYFGMSMSWNDITIQGVEDTTTKIFGFQYGKMLTERFGVEGRLNIGIGKYTVQDCAYVGGQLQCSSQNVSVSSTFSLAGRGYLFTDGTLRPYGVLGITRGNVDVDINDVGNKYSETGLSYGVGIDIGNDSLAFTVEVISLLDVNDVELSGYSLGFISRF